MSNKYSLDEIKTFWTEQAKKHGKSPAASWSDHNVIELEIAEISARLNNGDRVLDIGCANGYSTLHFAESRNIQIVGLDYIPEMIAEANENLRSFPKEAGSKVDFAVGNIMCLEQPDASYDTVVVVRVLINLGSWENQKLAMSECSRVLKPGGMLLLSEATVQGWRKINLLRGEWNLSEIPMPPFNEYLDQDKVIQEVSPTMELVELVNFSSTYFVLTRLFKPLL
ncbi:MAG: class I SAM-dependent methyltransferase, partial [Candidatus Melainabacteria bacterium]|nr:class I SAM-dependent methyltransferase [Candidatus Melainabacteria bacterium]